MDPSWSTLVNIITELQQEKRDVKMAFEKRVADLELELRIEQQRNSALMTQLIEVLGNGPSRNAELMHQSNESLQNRPSSRPSSKSSSRPSSKPSSRLWAEREIGDQPSSQEFSEKAKKGPVRIDETPSPSSENNKGDGERRGTSPRQLRRQKGWYLGEGYEYDGGASPQSSDYGDLSTSSKYSKRAGSAASPQSSDCGALSTSSRYSERASSAASLTYHYGRTLGKISE
ncbi:Aldo-keto reductase yakc [NADP(+)] [Venturia inaequalis]|nr:Aldo-keto reductase yakc [NADP(+)] [Venturia inaequalis]